MKRLLGRLTLTQVMIGFTASGFLVAYVIFAFAFTDDFRRGQMAQQDAKLADLVVLAGAVVHEMQKERGASSGFLASAEAGFEERLAQQRARTDAALADYTSHLAAPGQRGDPLESAMAAVAAAIQQIGDLRVSVDTRATERNAVVEAYTAVNTTLFDLVKAISSVMTDPNAARSAEAHALLLSGKEMAGLERAAGSAGFAIAAELGRFPPEILLQFQRLGIAQGALFDAFERTADAELAQALRDVRGSVEATSVAEIRAIASAPDTAAIQSISGPAFFDTITTKIELLREVEVASADALARLMLGTVKQIRQGLWLDAVLMAFITVLIVGSAFAIILPVTRDIRALIVRVEGLESGDIDSPVPRSQLVDLGMVGTALDGFCQHARQEAAQHDLDVQQQQQSAAGIERVRSDVAENDFSSRLRSEGFQGPALTLANGLNEILATVEEVVTSQRQREAEARAVALRDEAAQEAAVQELHEIVEACSRGDFSHRIELAGKNGVYRDISEGVNTIASTAATGLQQISASLSAVAQGDLSQRMSPEFDGAYGEIRTALEVTLGRLDQLLGEIAEQSGAVQGVAAEIAGAMADLSARTKAQADAVAESTAVTKDLTAQARDTACGMAEGVELAERLSAHATEGATISKQAIEAIGGIESASGEMAKIVSVIDDIAFQTNLLALNASVEAARAGAAGKGFAVVASEVRSLAGRCAEASSQIGGLIDRNVDVVRSSASRVRASGEALNQITTAVDEMTALFARVSQTAQTQADGSAEIATAVQRIDQITSENGAVVQRNSDLTDQLADGGGHLAALVAAFRGEDIRGENVSFSTTARLDALDPTRDGNSDTVRVA